MKKITVYLEADMSDKLDDLVDRFYHDYQIKATKSEIIANLIRNENA